MKKTKIATFLVVFYVVTSQLVPAWAERINDPLVANDFTKETPLNTTLNFTINDFKDSVNPPPNSAFDAVTFKQLPETNSGTLRIGTEPVKYDVRIEIARLDQLNFVPAKDYEGEAIFTWDAHYGTQTSPYPSAVTIKIGTGTFQPTEPTPTPEATESPKPTESTTPTPPPENTQKPLQYEDMLEHWGAYSAGMLGAEGIIVGEEIGGHFYFYPDKILTRMDFITLACSVFHIKTKDSTADNPFADSDIPNYMLRQAIAAYEAGLISGKEKGGRLYVDPYERLTRAEAIKILDNGLKIENPATEPLSFADSNDIPSWATQAVMNMEAYGIVKGYEDNTFRPYAQITKAQAGELLYQVYKFREKMRKTKSVFNTVFYGEI